MTTTSWLDLLKTAAIGLSDLDDVRELGMWHTGGGCTCLGAEFDHGGDTFRIMVTIGGMGVDAPTEADDLVDVGVYADGGDTDPDEPWALAERVDRAALVDVVAILLDLVRQYGAADIVLDPHQWGLDVAATRAARRPTVEPSTVRRMADEAGVDEGEIDDLLDEASRDGSL